MPEISQNEAIHSENSRARAPWAAPQVTISAVAKLTMHHYDISIGPKLDGIVPRRSCQS